MLRKNDEITLTLTDIAGDGNAVGRAEDGMAVFVPFGAPGDVARVRLVKVLKSHAYGILQELQTAAPCRVARDCAGYGRCGSCSLRHISYEQELMLKNGWVRNNLRRFAGLEWDLPPVLPSPQVDRYRNKAILPIALRESAPVLGFYAKRSHRVEPMTDCLLHPTQFADIAEAVRLWLDGAGVPVYDEQTHTGLARSLFLRHAEATGELMAALVVNGEALPDEQGFVDAVRRACPETRSVILNQNTDRTNVLLGQRCRTLWGSDTITDILCGLRFSISPLSFYQVNRRGAEQLYGVAADFAALQGGETLLDLYCGAGTIGLSMAHRVKRLVGVEVVPQAIENARANALQNNIVNAEFICADAAEAAPRLAAVHPDVVVLDPPRKGCAPALVRAVAQMAPARVVMVSCDSATAARDIKLFGELGYTVQRVQAVDMFARTAHVETVFLLRRKD